MSGRTMALALAAVEDRNWQAVADLAAEAVGEGYRPALELVAMAAYKRRDYAAAIAALEALKDAGEGAGPTAHAMLARLHLLTGNLRRGWQLIRDACRLGTFGPSLYTLPHWNGEPLAGRRIVAWGLGYGDDIFFARFLPDLAATGATVFLTCRPQLVRLFRSLSCVADVLPADGVVPEADFQIHVAELAAMFSTDGKPVAPDGPYLWAEPMALAGTGRRVGLTWACDSRHWEAGDRCAALADMAPLSRVPGVKLYGLQFDVHAAQLSPAPAGMEIEDLRPRHQDFADTAAAITAMDLVITIDTSVANLAGALGVPVWVVVPLIPDWRWAAEGSRTPWYPTATVYRQTVPGDWKTVFRTMAEDLAVRFRHTV
jgi:hypothetical protein